MIEKTKKRELQKEEQKKKEMMEKKKEMAEKKKAERKQRRDNQSLEVRRSSYRSQMNTLNAQSARKFMEMMMRHGLNVSHARSGTTLSAQN